MTKEDLIREIDSMNISDVNTILIELVRERAIVDKTFSISMTRMIFNNTINQLEANNVALGIINERAGYLDKYFDGKMYKNLEDYNNPDNKEIMLTHVRKIESLSREGKYSE